MKKNRPAILIVYTVVGLLSLIAMAIVARRTLKLIPVLTDGYHAPPRASNDRLQALIQADDIFAHYPVLTLIHIIPGLFFILTGPFQFGDLAKRLQKKWLGITRKVFFISGFIVGVTAFIISIFMPSIGGVNQASATVLFSLLLLFFLVKAYLQAKHHRSILAREWRLRAYAIGLAIATIRPIIGAFFATAPLSGLTPYEFFGTAFWIGFVVNLLLAEAWIYNTRQDPAR